MLVGLRRSLARFHPPDADGFVVAIRYETLPWMDEQIERVGRALEFAIARYKELAGS